MSDCGFPRYHVRMSTTRRSTIGIVIVCLGSFGVPRHVNGQGRGRGAVVTLPDGPGKEAVQAQCTKCHALGLIANSGGFTRQGWHELMGTMVSLPAAQQSAITEYLANNFPEQPR